MRLHRRSVMVAVVALESTVIAHGLPYPQNLETARSLEKIVRENGAVPATIAIFDGELCVALSGAQIERLATGKDIRKISRRDLAIAVARKLDGATTAAATAFIAHRAGIKVFATGGIGGVHRGAVSDVSADRQRSQRHRSPSSAPAQRSSSICQQPASGSKPTGSPCSVGNATMCLRSIRDRAVLRSMGVSIQRMKLRSLFEPVMIWNSITQFLLRFKFRENMH